MFVVKIVQDEALYPFQSEAILQYAAEEICTRADFSMLLIVS
jgi:hypothetical protein